MGHVIVHHREDAVRQVLDNRHLAPTYHEGLGYFEADQSGAYHDCSLALGRERLYAPSVLYCPEHVNPLPQAGLAFDYGAFDGRHRGACARRQHYRVVGHLQVIAVRFLDMGDLAAAIDPGHGRAKVKPDSALPQTLLRRLDQVGQFGYDPGYAVWQTAPRVLRVCLALDDCDLRVPVGFPGELCRGSPAASAAHDDDLPRHACLLLAEDGMAIERVKSFPTPASQSPEAVRRAPDSSHDLGKGL